MYAVWMWTTFNYATSSSLPCGCGLLLNSNVAGWLWTILTMMLLMPYFIHPCSCYLIPSLHNLFICLLHVTRAIGKRRALQSTSTRYDFAAPLLVRTCVWRCLATRLKRLVDSNWWVGAPRLTALKTVIQHIYFFIIV